MSKANPPKPDVPEAPAMPFNEALKRVWAAKPAPKVKAKPAKVPDKSAAKRA